MPVPCRKPIRTDHIARASAARRGFTLIEFIVVVGIIGLLVALLLPAVRSSSGQAVRRAQCVNNLKQIALALYNYKDVYGVLPPAYSVDANGRPLHSWRTLILPYAEGDSLYEKIDLTKPWNDPANAEALKAMPLYFRCPAAKEGENKTVYLAIVGPDACFLPDRPRPIEEITDGTSNTVMVIEIDEEHAVPWMAPTDAGEALVLGIKPESKLQHPGGVNAAFADGSVRFLKANLAATVRRALLTAAGGEKISADQY